ncbi:MAG: hypothetical protein EA397_09565 [Deltaproteobacteria bacterium]|nr:MAG: hypothetical protein EA397_09565 [Deltaproteobacteria bacterium]
MRTALLSLLLACSSGRERPERAEPLQLEVRLPNARRAVQTHLGTYVWPTSLPPEDLTQDDPLCRWWHGARGQIPLAHAGLREGQMRWAVLSITPDALSFGDSKVLTLDRGHPDPAEVVGGRLPKLSEALVDAREHLDAWYEVCGKVYRDRPLLAADADVPVQTVGLVLQTASDLRFPRVAALVRDPSPGERRTMDPDDPGHLAVVRQRGEQLELFSADGTRRRAGPIREMQALLGGVMGGERYGCTLVIGEGQTRWEELAATLDTSQAFRAHSSFVLFEPRSDGLEPPPDRPGTPRELLSTDRRASVLWIELPSVQWRDVDRVDCGDIVHGPLGREAPLPVALRAALDHHGDEIPAKPHLPSGLRAETPISLRVVGPAELGSAEEPVPPLAPFLARAKTCANEASARPESPSEVAMGFEIGPNGQTFDRYTASLEPDDAIHACLTQAFDALEAFPALDEGRYASVVIGLKVR